MRLLALLDVVSNCSRRDLDWNFLVLALSSALWYESWGCLRTSHQVFRSGGRFYREREFIVQRGFLDRIRVEGSHKHLKKQTNNKGEVSQNSKRFFWTANESKTVCFLLHYYGRNCLALDYLSIRLFPINP
jgi:hypothetical protein